MYARIKGHSPKLSQTLKKNVAETIAFLGAFGDKLEAGTNIDIIGAMDQVVRNILSSNAKWHRWASLGSRLALLAEASPISFLRAVQADLNCPEPELVELFRDEADTFFGGCNHAGLLWALETLAWSKQYLADVSRILLKLTEITPRGRWGNRPDASLEEILSDWIPHTMANVDERIKVLDILISDLPDTAWKILLQLLPPATCGVSTPTHRPIWRNWADSWNRGISWAESLKFSSAVGERIIIYAECNALRWTEIFKNLGRFPDTIHNQLDLALKQLVCSTTTEADRHVLSETLSEQINIHREFSEATWALTTEFLDKLESSLQQLKPDSCILQNAWLFKQWPDRFSRGNSQNYQENQKLLEKSRDDALNKILTDFGFEGVISLVEKSESPDVVGYTLARISDDRYISELIPRLLSSKEKYLSFTRGFIWMRYRIAGWFWVDNVLDRCIIEEDRASFLLALPFEKETWLRANKNEIRRHKYWKNCRAWNYELEEGDLQLAVESLIEHNRPAATFDLLAMAIHSKRPIPTETLLAPLEAILQLGEESAKEQFHHAQAYDIVEIIGALQDKADVDLTRLLRIEWNFLGMLDGHHGRKPQTLQKHLCNNPEFFIELLSLLYRSKNGSPNDSTNTMKDEWRAANATQGYRLLHNWDIIPGMKDDGSIDEGHLCGWCEKARRLANECGRIDICDSHIGQIFVHAPKEADGRWPCATVCQLIEQINSESLRSGVYCGIFNSRGMVFRGRGGDQERELAANYRQQAEAIRFDFPVTASILDDVANAYEREGRDWDEEERWNE
jgi:hypothetical protein